MPDLSTTRAVSCHRPIARRLRNLSNAVASILPETFGDVPPLNGVDQTAGGGETWVSIIAMPVERYPASDRCYTVP